ncbi:MAG: response regulator [Myxococcaceae bacterium]
MKPTANRRILVVDDEENVCNALRRSLRQEGYELYFATAPSAGLELLSSTPMDLVLSDHLMPDMSGYEFLKLVRERYPDCLRLLLTGRADPRAAVAAVKRGEVYRFLTKPWDDAELKMTLFLAFEQLRLQRQNRLLLAMVRRRHEPVVDFGHGCPGTGAHGAPISPPQPAVH